MRAICDSGARERTVARLGSRIGARIRPRIRRASSPGPPDAGPRGRGKFLRISPGEVPGSSAVSRYMKNIKHIIALAALGFFGLVGLRTAQACYDDDCYHHHHYYAYDEASAFCSAQAYRGIQCRVVSAGYGCGPYWYQARVFTDGHSAYVACMH